MVKQTGIRTFELVVPISGPLDVPSEDWPSNVQDGIAAALERASDRLQLPLKVVYAEYKVDYDKAEEAPGRHYLHVVASEVVMADERTIDKSMLTLPENLSGLLH